MIDSRTELSTTCPELGIDRVRTERNGEQREAEFAADGQCEAGAPGSLGVEASETHDAGHQGSFDREQADGPGECPVPDARDCCGIDQHADADEEQPQQDVAKGSDRCFHLMAELGLAQHHAREKGAKGERQSELVRNSGSGQRNEQHGEREDFGGAPFRDQTKERSQQPATGCEHDRAGQHRLAERHREGAGERPSRKRPAQHRNYHHEGDRGHVLKYRKRQREASVPRSDPRPARRAGER